MKLTRLSEMVTLSEGGFASTKTQQTIITPRVVVSALNELRNFERAFNAFIKDRKIPKIKIGNPVGSGTYYKRDLEQDPEREYGDIDIQFIVQEMPDLNHNQTTKFYADLIKTFCEQSNKYETSNGVNLILNLKDDQFVQVDLVTIYSNNVDWTLLQAPEWRVKGVLAASMLSAFAEAINVSINTLGIQMKTVDGNPVKFSTVKGTQLLTVTKARKSWAMDTAKHFGCTKFSPLLKKYPGMMEEVRVADHINSIRGVAETFELNNILDKKGLNYSSADELLAKIKAIYLAKIDKLLKSSKWDKAANSDEFLVKAEKTKTMLATKSAAFADLLS